MLGNLGVASRIEAATVANRFGLVDQVLGDWAGEIDLPGLADLMLDGSWRAAVAATSGRVRRR